MKEEYSIVLGIATIFFLFFLIEMNLYLYEIFTGVIVFTVVAFPIGGFLATFTSNNGRMRIGLFSGVLFSLLYVFLFNVMFSPLDEVQFMLTYGVALSGSLFAGLGSFIAKFIRERYDITPKLLKNFLYRLQNR